MSSLNRVTILGRLGKDPETKITANTTICNFSVATSEKYTDKQGQIQQKTEWHKVVAFGKLAEVIAKHLNKGSQCLVEGKLQTRSWETDNGEKKYSTEIVANNVVFTGSGEPKQQDEFPF